MQFIYYHKANSWNKYLVSFPIWHVDFMIETFIKKLENTTKNKDFL